MSNLDKAKNVASIALVILVLMYFFAPDKFNKHIVMPMYKRNKFKNKELGKKVTEFINLANSVTYKYKRLNCKEHKKNWLKMIDNLDMEKYADKICTFTKEDMKKEFIDIYTENTMFKENDLDNSSENDMPENILNAMFKENDLGNSSENDMTENMSDDMPNDIKKMYMKLHEIVIFVKMNFCKNDKFQIIKFKQYLKDLINAFCSNTGSEDMIMTNIHYALRPLSYL